MAQPSQPEIGNWKNGTTVLIEAVESYRAGKDLSAMHLAAIRGYMRDCTLKDDPDIARLRRNISVVRSHKTIARWIINAKALGLDPL